MPPPSALAIATNAVNRLLEEIASYDEELVRQEAEVRRLEEEINNGQDDEEGNADYILNQQRRVVGQTKGVFEPLRAKLAAAVTKLEEELSFEEHFSEEHSSVEQSSVEQSSVEQNDDTAPTEIGNAKTALEKARELEDTWEERP